MERIDRRKLLDALSKAVGGAEDKTARNILLAGPWGSGKTALLLDFRRHIERESESSNPPPYVLWFSPWSSFADGDPRRAFLRLLRDEMEKYKNADRGIDPSARKRIIRLLGVFTKALDTKPVEAALTLLSPLTGGLLPAISGGAKLASALIENSLEGQKSGSGNENQIERMRKGVRQLLLDISSVNSEGKEGTPQKRRRIFLLVDDLDRAKPEDAVAILDNLYHLFMPHEDESTDEDWPLTSIWAVNTAVLEEFLYREYRELPSFDPNAYLEKLFSLRINVPPLITPPQENEKQTKSGETKTLWRHTLKEISDQLGDIPLEKLAEELSSKVNYAILGNLRLHARVRRDCIRLWSIRKRDRLQNFIRDAQLIVLIDSFSYFREQIAPFNGMWPHFVNQINKRHTDRPTEWVANPLYRHVDSPDLHTLLQDVGALRFDTATRCYLIEKSGRSRLQQDLIDLWEDGF